MENTFYKMILSESEEGLVIFTKRFISIHETPCMHFCVSEYDYKFPRWNPGETRIQAAKRNKMKIYRIHKIGSRVAFDSEQKAFENLRYRKEKRIRHLERDLDITKRFLSDTEGKSIDSFESDGPYRVMPMTAGIVGQYYRFD